MCDRGACSTLTDVASDGDARELVANGSTLAWLYDDRLRVLTSGSVATWAAGLPAAGEESEAGAIALGDGFAVVADRAGRRLVRVDPVAVTTLAPGAFASVVVRDGVAYALRLAAEEPGAIVRVPLDGAAQTTLAGGLSVTHGCRIAVDDARVWWTDPDAAIVWRVDVGGGPPQPWATRQRMACGVVVDDARAYWIAVDPTLAVFLVRVAKGATPDPDWIQTTTEVGQYSPGKPAWDLALAGGTVWVANHHDGALWRISTASGERSLAAGAQSIRGVAAGDVVAWATRAGVVGMVP